MHDDEKGFINFIWQWSMPDTRHHLYCYGSAILHTSLRKDYYSEFTIKILIVKARQLRDLPAYTSIFDCFYRSIRLQLWNIQPF